VNTGYTIFIKRIRDRWRVWIGNINDPDPQPAKCDAKFYKFEDAEVYAREWETRSFVAGVKVLE
jgi:hypothetical protein